MDHFPNKKITRRQFIKGAAAAATLPLFPKLLPPYGSLAHAAEEADMVIAKTGSPSQLLQAAMAPLGGMGRFVKKGQRVVSGSSYPPHIQCPRRPQPRPGDR